MTDNVYAVILAAGRSARFGATKQLLRYEGQTLVQRACALARGACGPRSLLIVGHEAPAVADAAQHSFYAVNENYREGIGTSIALAARVLSDKADALLILLADQPMIGAEHLEAMLDEWRAAPGSIVTSTFADTSGPPVLFPKAAFDALAGLVGDRGARAVVESGRYPVIGVPCAAAAVDIDTPEDAASMTE